MEKYGLHNKLKASLGNGNALTAILLEAASVVATSTGCQLYMVSQDALDHDLVWITEVWDNKAAHEDSLKLEAVRALIGKAMPLIAEPPQRGNELIVRGGLGLSEL